MEGINLSAVPGREGRMLLDAMRVKPVNPENRIIDPIADRIGSFILRNLHNAAQAKCAEGRIIKNSRTGDVRDSDACVVDHCNLLISLNCFRLFSRA
jgi:hypothetical protein